MSDAPRPTRRLPAAASGILALLAGVLVTVAGAAPPSAAEEPAGPPAIETVTAQPMATWQTNGVVYAVETVGNVVYAGGNFTRVRPPGAAAGQQEVARKNIAAFNATTGELLPFSHTFTAPNYPVPGAGPYDQTCSPGTAPNTYTCDTVYEIRASRDGSRIYAGGDFTAVDGQARGNLAAFSTGNNSLLSWRVTGIAGRVRALTVSDDTVYFGGSFTRAGTEARGRLAAASASTGAVLPWAPSADRLVIAMELADDDSRVILGGQFDTVNGASIHGLAAVSSAGTGESARWDSRPIPPTSYVTDLSVDGDTVFASANGEGGGVFDGRLAAEVTTGILRWQDVCLGATWAIETAGELVYSGSHAHDCSRTSGGFPESWFVSPPAIPRYYRLLAQTKEGEYAPHIQHWFPTTNGGIVGKLGPRDLTWTGQQLWVAGEFTTVNGAPQQGLTRFGMMPAATSAAPLRPDAPTASSARPGEVRVSFRATEDIDDETLTYTVLRGVSTGAMTAIGTVEGRSKPWQRPILRFKDTTAVTGQSYVYQVQAVDPHGRTSTRSFPGSVTVATSVDPYANAVLDSDPTLFWRLDDAAGSTDVRAVVGSAGTAASGATFGGAGAVDDVDPGDTSVRTNGTGSGTVGSNDAEAGPNVFSAEVWFKAAPGQTGKLFGFGNSQLGGSSNYDRHVYVRPDGRLNFGVYPGGVATVTSARAYTDDRWHHVVASLGPAGMRLFVDGAAVASRADVTTAQGYSGYWRLGYDNLNGWPDVGSHAFTGDLDEFAVYDRQLSAADVLAHRAAGVDDQSPPTAPVIVTGGAGGSTVALGWTASEDDVAVARYEVHRLSAEDGTPSAATLAAVTDGTSATLASEPTGVAFYKVVAVDPAGNTSPPSAARRIQVYGVQPYSQAVLADSPAMYWTLGDEAGSTTVNPLVGPAGNTGAGATQGVAGALPGGDPAVRTNGASSGGVASAERVPGPQEFTTEAWFRTTTNVGGKIIGFGNQRFGNSSNYDRHVYMVNDGRLTFGVWLGYAATVTSTASYNDGAWHHVATSIGPEGLRLMVDGQVVGLDPGVRGAQAYEGYWRLGGDTTWGGASSHYFAGDLDEFAVYNRQLSVTDIQGHVATTLPDTIAPTAPGAPAVTVTAARADLTWTASTDAVGVEAYDVHRSATSGFTPSAATLVATVPATSASEDDLAPGTWYYRVVARDAADNASDASPETEATVAPPDLDPPTVPQNVDADVAQGDVTITWDAATDAGAVRYELHRGATSGFTPAADTLVAETTATSAVDGGRPPGTSYYRVVAVDDAGNRSQPSAAASATVLRDPVTVTLGATDDAWVDSTLPTRNYGNAWALTADGTPQQDGHLRFALPAAPAGLTLTSAVLTLSTSANSFAGSADAAQVRLSGGPAWSETALTWNNRPDTGALLGQLAAGTAPDTGYDITLDAAALSALLGGDGDLVLTTTSSDAVQVVSSEGAATRRPTLVLTFS